MFRRTFVSRHALDIHHYRNQVRGIATATAVLWLTTAASWVAE